MVNGLNRSACCVVYHAWEKIVLIFIIAILCGCSSDFSRFSERVTEKEVTFHREAHRKIEGQPAPPISAITSNVAHDIASYDLPPVVSSAPVYPVQEENSDPDLSHSKHSHPMPLPQKKILGTLLVFEANQAQKGIENKNKETVKYTVQQGDTLFAISRNYNTTVSNLKIKNSLREDLIRIGQVLTVPCCNISLKGHSTVFEDNAYKSTVKHHNIENTVKTPFQSKEAKNNFLQNPTKTVYLPNEDKKIVEHSKHDARHNMPEERNSSQNERNNPANFENNPRLRLYWPVRGRILNHYGQHRGVNTNEGVDIEVPEGTPVKAADSGVVIYADEGLKEFGKTVLIRHDKAFVTVYGHNSVILVQRGQQIQRGEEIARSGMSGNALTPQLHFEVRQDSNPVNPLSYLES